MVPPSEMETIGHWSRPTLSSPIGDVAGAGERPEHVVPGERQPRRLLGKRLSGDDHGVKSLRISVGSTAGTLGGTSPKPGYASPNHTAALPVDV